MYGLFSLSDAGIDSCIDQRTGADSVSALEDELHELEGQEEALEDRTHSLEVSGPLTLIFSIVAMALAMGALIVALSNKGPGSENIVSSSLSGSGAASSGTKMGSSANGGTMMGSSATHGKMMGAGGHGSFTSSQISAAGHGTVYVQLGDYWAAPAVSSVKTGKVTFIARNVGRVPHELMIERMPIKFDAPMQPNEDSAQGMIADMTTGQSGRMSVRLTPGTYMLFCNAPGHYALGQHILFKVSTS
jgi:uncharacterized cupredoxin-like copper-binding protein